MATRDTLFQLRETLLTRRSELCKKLARELAYLRKFRAANSTCDIADMAFENSSDETSSQLAELNARELGQVERALARLRHGTYGICEGGSDDCRRRIPLARLSALPYTTLCINCEREMERRSNWLDRLGPDNWAQVSDWESPTERQHLTVSTLEKALPGRR
jgi:DnaK suppressor protein